MVTDEQIPEYGTAEPITVSIKPSTDYNSALLVVKGTPHSIKANIIAFFGLSTSESTATETPYQTFLRGEQMAQSNAPAVEKKQQWRGKPKASTPAASTKTEAAPSHDEAVANAEAGLGATKESEETTKEHPYAALITSIADATDQRRILQLLQADPKAAADPDVKAAVKAQMAKVG